VVERPPAGWAVVLTRPIDSTRCRVLLVTAQTKRELQPMAARFWFHDQQRRKLSAVIVAAGCVNTQAAQIKQRC